MGKALEMPRPIYGGHTPATMARKTTIRPNVTEEGQFAGRSVIRRGVVGAWTWQHLDKDWVRRKLYPFILAAEERPFFLLWRPETFPDEAVYCWTEGAPAPVNMGLSGYMSFTLEAAGHG